MQLSYLSEMDGCVKSPIGVDILEASSAQFRSKGRYRSIPKFERKCQICSSGNIKEEIRVMFVCKANKNRRLQWLSEIGINE